MTKPLPFGNMYCAHRFEHADGGSYFAVKHECERNVFSWAKLEALWAQFKVVRDGKDCIRAYSAFHAPATQMVMGRGERAYIDLTLSFSSGVLRCFQFHETASHAVYSNGHKTDCPRYDGVPLVYNDATVKSDRFNREYTAYLSENIDWLHMTFESECECDWFCRENLRSIARNDPAFVTTPAWVHEALDADEAERRLLAEDGQPSIDGFVAVRGGGERQDLQGGAHKLTGFLLQRSKRTVSELGPTTLDIMVECMNLEQSRGESDEDFDTRRKRAAWKELERICGQESTVMRRTLPADKDTFLSTHHFRFLVKSGRLTGYKITMILAAEYRDYLAPFAWKLLQARKDETKSKARSTILKLVGNGYYGFAGIVSFS